MASITDAELGSLQGLRVALHPHYGIVSPGPGRVGGVVMPGDTVNWGSWSVNPLGKWFVAERLSGSDYSGGFVNRANFEAFMADADPNDLFSVVLHGGHATYGIALLIEDTPREVWEMLLALEQYPSVDDDRVSALEAEATDEAWHAWALHDYKRLWEKRIDDNEDNEDFDYLPVDWVDQVSDDQWWEHFEGCREVANLYWEPQGDTREVSIDVERVVNQCAEPPWPPTGGGPSPTEPGATEPSAPAGGAPPGPTPPAGAERPPRFKWTPGQIREFKARGLRQGYDFNPRRSPIEEALDNDPYAGLSIVGRDPAWRDLLVSGSVVQNVTYDQSPHDRAILLIRCGREADQYYLVCWWETASGWYTVTIFDFSEAIAVAGGDVDPRLPSRVGMSDDSWQWVKEGLDRKDPSAFAVYYRWWDDAEFSPRLWDTPKLSGNGETHTNIPLEQLRSTYSEVFDLYSSDEPERAAMVETVQRQPASIDELEQGERPPRFNWTPGAIREFRSRGLRPGYDFNPAGGLAAGMRPGDFDPEQLALGTRVELEHTGDVRLAQAIAMDHLVERPDYYDALARAGL